MELVFAKLHFKVVSHPAIVPSVLLASAYGLLYKQVSSSEQIEEVVEIRTNITQRMVLDEAKKATKSGSLALIEHLVTIRLKDH